MANEHTKTLLLWDILVPSPDIFTLIFCKGNSIFFSYEKNTTQETINILFFGLTYCIVGNISLTLILNILNMLNMFGLICKNEFLDLKTFTLGI